ncbi:hypothetical protein FQN50_009567 [Emmonsiellopsis sp. PD_5]|nr:hypothetical protein FQN50_009567 [Emmonsiellopsis sp. PD_5]
MASMVMDKLTSALGLLVYSLGMIFIGPIVYCCIWISDRRSEQREQTAPSRAAGRRKTAIWGLARTEPRRRLSMTYARLEEGHSQSPSDDKTAKLENGNGNGNNKRQRSLWHNNPLRRKTCQHESLFLTRLPPEVRFMIYGYVLSCERMHVVTTASKMASVRCSKDVVDGVSYRVDGFCECLRHSVTVKTHFQGCVGHELPAAPVSFNNPNAKRGAKDALNLLQVSRKVYSETITVLYQSLTFHMHPVSFLGFSISIPDHHLKLIRKLDLGTLPVDYLDSYIHLDYFPPFRKIPHTPNNPGERPKFYIFDHETSLYNPSRVLSHEKFSIYRPRPPTAWEVACQQILPRMTGLTELRISLDHSLLPGVGFSRATERYLLQPLAELSLPNLRVFAVQVNWKEGTEEQGWQHDADIALFSEGVERLYRGPMWLPNVLLWGRHGEFRRRGEGNGEAGLERWNSYVRANGVGEGVGEMWKDAPFKVVRKYRDVIG